MKLKLKCVARGGVCCGRNRIKKYMQRQHLEEENVENEEEEVEVEDEDEEYEEEEEEEEYIGEDDDEEDQTFLSGRNAIDRLMHIFGRNNSPATTGNPETDAHRMQRKEEVQGNAIANEMLRAQQHRCSSILKRLENRRIGYGGNLNRYDIYDINAHFLPVHYGAAVASSHHRVYGGKYSKDGSLFVVSTQGENVAVMDTNSGARNPLRLRKSIVAKNIRWTVTDTDVSPDNNFVAYSSISSTVHICNIFGDYELHDVLDFHEHVGIWCIRFNGDGREIIAGGNDCSFYVYDIVQKRVLHKIRAHSDDINSVAFADGDSKSNVFFTGSDDHLIKVWDRRTITDRCRAAGVLCGHSEGITYISSKGDGHYLVSNGKDQTAKLWDIRKMRSEAEQATLRPPAALHWDYRVMAYPLMRTPQVHPHDQSLMTYRGHLVLETLIRVHFSPQFSTGQKYIYTGSRDGSVVVYDVLTGEMVTRSQLHATTVRDVSWHPYRPELMSVSWDGQVVCTVPKAVGAAGKIHAIPLQ